eukprot:gene12189-biopygen9725
MGHRPLPSNYGNSIVRLNSQVKKFKKDPDIFKKCNDIIDEQVKLGIIEQVSEMDQANKIHYLPSQTVVRDDAETTKVRIVFDASSKDKNSGVSLNDCLHIGPSLTPLIFEMLLRFRGYSVPLVGDIEKAFLNIEVDPKDRDCLRFLWKTNLEGDDSDIMIFRFNRVVFGVNSSPFLLNAVLRNHIETYEHCDPEFVMKMKESFYVDDMISGANNRKEAFDLYLKAKGRMKEGGFRLRKWKTSDVELSQKIKESEGMNECQPGQAGGEEMSYAKEMLGVEKASDSKTKVLGLIWDSCKDNLEFKLSKVSNASNEQPTKRGILSTLGTIFDPLGIISPISVIVKVLFQELCMSKLSWDDAVPREKAAIWDSWLEDLSQVNTVTLSRCIFDLNKGEILRCHLHGFGDASKKAYCAVVYMVYETSTGTYTTLLCSKTRVAPLKELTIPRLELLSARILAVLMDTVCTALKSHIKIDSKHYWLDSTTALYWIFHKGQWKQWVQFRVSEILKLSEMKDWSHVGGTENPADIGSRGIMASQLKDNELWFQGPEWLKKGEDQWPKKLEISESEEVGKEKKKVNVMVVSTNVQTGIGQIVDIDRYSTLNRLLRITAWVKRVVANLKGKINKGEVKSGNLSASEFKEAEKLWIRDVQALFKADKDFKTTAKQLSVVEVEGILVCKGRLENASLDLSSRYPALISKEHRFTELLVLDCHERVQHCGVRATLAEMRSRFWVPRGRQVVKKLLKKCLICRRQEGLAFRNPPTAALPEFRVSEAPPFSYVGVDFAGPLFVKEKQGKMSKVYICLFSCCLTRALHLEIVNDLTAVSFLNCLRRFCARRGTPSIINSDNAKTFKSIASFLKKMGTDEGVTGSLGYRGIEWKFNLAVSPWQGGHFERMVRSVKRCLRKVLGNARVNLDELTTVLTEVENNLNSRPLTFEYDELEEQVLTPSHLLVGRRLSSLSEGIELKSNINDDDINNSLNKRFLYLSRKLDHFWNRWRKEYLIDLREAHRVSDKGPAVISEGDVVLVHEEKVKRGMWKMAVVEKLIFGKDNQVRGATIKRVAKGKGKPEIIDRPIQRLFPLECVKYTGGRHECMNGDKGDARKNGDEGESQKVVDVGCKAAVNDAHGGNRPRRAAAQDARAKTRLMLDSE